MQIPPEPPSRGEPSLSPATAPYHAVIKMALGTELCAPKTHVLKSFKGTVSGDRGFQEVIKGHMRSEDGALIQD